jgi:hypothetical protein
MNPLTLLILVPVAILCALILVAAWQSLRDPKP